MRRATRLPGRAEFPATSGAERAHVRPQTFFHRYRVGDVVMAKSERAAPQIPQGRRASQRALAKEKDAFLRTRYTFYLARSYHHAGNNAAALKAYMKRTKMGGWAEEVFISH